MRTVVVVNDQGVNIVNQTVEGMAGLEGRMMMLIVQGGEAFERSWTMIIIALAARVSCSLPPIPSLSTQAQPFF